MSNRNHQAAHHYGIVFTLGALSLQWHFVQASLRSYI